MAMNIDKQANTDAAGQESVAPLARYFLWVDSKPGVDRLIRMLVYACAALFLFDIVWPRHGKVPGEGLWGFHAIAGFVSFSLIVVGARFLRVFIRRDESFYAPNSVDAEEYPEVGTQRLTHGERQEETLAGFGQELLGRTSKSNEQGGASS